MEFETHNFLIRIERAEALGGLTDSQEELLDDLHKYFAAKSASPSEPRTEIGKPCPTCGKEVMPEFGPGEYSCAACGFGMLEPCEHWNKMLAQPKPEDDDKALQEVEDLLPPHSTRISEPRRDEREAEPPSASDIKSFKKAIRNFGRCFACEWHKGHAAHCPAKKLLDYVEWASRASAALPQAPDRCPHCHSPNKAKRWCSSKDSGGNHISHDGDCGTCGHPWHKALPLDEILETLKFAQEVIHDQAERFHKECRCQLCESLPESLQRAMELLEGSKVTVPQPSAGQTEGK